MSYKQYDVNSKLEPVNTNTAGPFNQIEVLDLVHISNRAAVRAMCKVRIGPLIISDVKILYPVLSSHAFVSWPSRKVGNAWQPLVQILAPGLQQRITNAVIHAWRSADRHGGVR